jgi:hypothetical protein
MFFAITVNRRLQLELELLRSECKGKTNTEASCFFETPEIVIQVLDFFESCPKNRFLFFSNCEVQYHLVHDLDGTLLIHGTQIETSGSSK